MYALYACLWGFVSRPRHRVPAGPEELPIRRPRRANVSGAGILVTGCDSTERRSARGAREVCFWTTAWGASADIARASRGLFREASLGLFMEAGTRSRKVLPEQRKRSRDYPTHRGTAKTQEATEVPAPWAFARSVYRFANNPGSGDARLRKRAHIRRLRTAKLSS
jgi:hypothetical protein